MNWRKDEKWKRYCVKVELLLVPVHAIDGIEKATE